MDRRVTSFVQQLFELLLREDIVFGDVYGSTSVSCLSGPGTETARLDGERDGGESRAHRHTHAHTRTHADTDVRTALSSESRPYRGSSSSSVSSSSLTSGHSRIFAGGTSGVWTQTDKSEGKDEGSSDAADTSGSTALNSTNPSGLSAQKFIKYQSLRTIKNLPRVSVSLMLDSLMHSSAVLGEFATQTKRFRQYVTPYTVTGSVTFEDSIIENSSYGTQRVK